MIEEILELIKNTRGTNAKKQILFENKENKMLLKAFKYALDPFLPFNVVKVYKTKNRIPVEDAWASFFEVADKCFNRSVTGNAAIDLLASVFAGSTEAQEYWMRKILKKHLAIGMSEKTVNTVVSDLIPTFNVSLAQKFDFKRIKSSTIAIEPKLDGIRCFAIVEDGQAIIYARSGKIIANFNKTIGSELSTLGDGCYDGEIMGEDFTSLMRQAYRKEKIELEGTYLSLFDYLPLSEWNSKKAVLSCFDRYNILFCKLTGTELVSTGMGGDIPKISHKYLKLTRRSYVSANLDTIQRMHDAYVDQGYEGAMIKDIDAIYKFGRGWEVMKYKAFHDVDLEIQQLLEGTGKHSGKLGSVVVCFKGVDVQVGSGFSDELREKIWQNKELFVGRMIEARYQEITPDGSLRFPTFVCFRNDR